jgi:hypothetical protein
MQQPRFQPMEQPINNQQMPNQQYLQQPIQKPIGLLGKSVESLEIVKTTEIPMDGSISYFPQADNSVIYTKQFQMDGTTKIIAYKPVEEEKKETIKYVTIEDLNKAIEDIDFSELEDLKEDISDIKKQLKEFKSKKVKED